jgi:RloB-like protein
MARSRNPKSATTYRRRGPIREPYDVVLIVCEGKKTEPNYLRALRVAYGLSSVNVRIIPPPGNDPLTIVKFAIREMERDAEYNRAYCVFDRDQHATYDAALRRIQKHRCGESRIIAAIPSIPCFEVWILLHYQYSSAAYVQVGGTSACTLVIRDVQKYLPQYAKGHEVFSELSPTLDDALERAKRLERHNADTNSSNPATYMHHLVEYLIQLKR